MKPSLSKFQEEAGNSLKCRFFPGSGYEAVPQDNTTDRPRVIPGDPDLLPPTTKENIATLLNTSGHRAGVNQVHGSIQEGSVPVGRFSYWVGNDMYLYIITRDLCKSTYTHLPCMEAFKGEERIKAHIATCNAEMSCQLDSLYAVPHLPNTLLTFGWALPIDGLWHLEFNCSMRIHQRLLQPIFGDSLAKLFGRKTPKAIQNFFAGTDHHKGNLVLEVCYLAGKFVLVKTYMKSTEPPHSSDGYFTWIATSVKNQYILMLNQLTFGALESYFQMKEGVRSGDTDMLMGGLIEAEKMFFFKKSNRNYQQCAAYRAGDLVKMPPEMRRRRLQNQASSATAYNSVEITGEDTVPKSKPQNAELSGHFQQKPKYPIRQGNDAILEQIIKRSKKGAKITNMDQRGWNTEFRVMPLNIAIRKKIERDTGRNNNTEGDHVRKNLAEIILVQHLIEKSGWMETPNEHRSEFVNIDGDLELSVDLVEFWTLCGHNRNVGVSQLLGNKRVIFKDVCALKEDHDENIQDIKEMLKNLKKMIETIPADHPMKVFATEHFGNEIKTCRNIATVENFYNVIQEVISNAAYEAAYEADNEADIDTDQADS